MKQKPSLLHSFIIRSDLIMYKTKCVVKVIICFKYETFFIYGEGSAFWDACLVIYCLATCAMDFQSVLHLCGEVSKEFHMARSR